MITGGKKGVRLKNWNVSNSKTRLTLWTLCIMRVDLLACVLGLRSSSLMAVSAICAVPFIVTSENRSPICQVTSNPNMFIRLSYSPFCLNIVLVVVIVCPEADVVFSVSFSLKGRPSVSGMSAPSINKNWKENMIKKRINKKILDNKQKITSTVNIPETGSSCKGLDCKPMSWRWEGLISSSSTPTIPKPKKVGVPPLPLSYISKRSSAVCGDRSLKRT